MHGEGSCTSIGMTSEIFQFIIASSSAHAWGGKLYKSSIGMTSEIIQSRHLFLSMHGEGSCTNQTSGMQFIALPFIAFSSFHAWGGYLYKSALSSRGLFFFPCIGKVAIQIKHRNDIRDYPVAAFPFSHAWGGKLYKHRKVFLYPKQPPSIEGRSPLL